jgi:hypothetical protein
MQTRTTEKPQTLPVTITRLAQAEHDLQIAQEVEALLLSEASKLRDRRAEVEEAWHRGEHELQGASTAKDIQALHERKARLQEEHATLLLSIGSLNQKGENARRVALEKRKAVADLRGHAAYLASAIPRQQDVIYARGKLLAAAEEVVQLHRETLDGMEGHLRNLRIELAEIVGVTG